MEGLLWIVLLFCVILILGVLSYVTGIFYGVEVKTGKPPVGRMTIAYKFARGSYKECGSLFDEVVSILPSSQRTLGIYYDDPKEVEQSKLRYLVAAVMSENGSPVDSQLQKRLADAGYKLYNLPEVKHAVTSHFPLRYLSLYVAIAKVYPKIDTYLEEHKLNAHPCVEVYDDSTIQYMVPLDNQDDFYVPEAKSG